MKFAAIIEYGEDKGALKTTHPAHRTIYGLSLRVVSCAQQARSRTTLERSGYWMLIARRQPMRSSRVIRLSRPV